MRSPKKFGEGFVTQTRHFCRGMHAHAEKNFVRVNIANTRDDPLIQQDRFHGATAFPQYFFELFKIDIKCVGSQRALFQKFVDIF